MRRIIYFSLFTCVFGFCSPKQYVAFPSNYHNQEKEGYRNSILFGDSMLWNIQVGRFDSSRVSIFYKNRLIAQVDSVNSIDTKTECPSIYISLCRRNNVFTVYTSDAMKHVTTLDSVTNIPYIVEDSLRLIIQANGQPFPYEMDLREGNFFFMALFSGHSQGYQSHRRRICY